MVSEAERHSCTGGGYDSTSFPSPNFQEPGSGQVGGRRCCSPRGLGRQSSSCLPTPKLGWTRERVRVSLPNQRRLAITTVLLVLCISFCRPPLSTRSSQLLSSTLDNRSLVLVFKVLISISCSRPSSPHAISLIPDRESTTEKMNAPKRRFSFVLGSAQEIGHLVSGTT